MTENIDIRKDSISIHTWEHNGRRYMRMTDDKSGKRVEFEIASSYAGAIGYGIDLLKQMILGDSSGYICDRES